MSWIESHQEVAHHPKTRKLARRLGVSIPAAIGHLHLLWWWSIDFAENGDLSRHDDEDIAIGAMWDDDPSTFVDALVDAGWIDRDDQATTIHDWPEYAGRLLDRRAANAARKRKSRAAARDAAGTSGAVTGLPNQTKPNQTEPNQENLAPKAARKRDLLFEAVAEVCGIQTAELTDTSRGAMNKALAMLRGVGADPAEVHLRARHWESVFPQATLTPTALAKHWPQLARERITTRPDRFVDMGRSLEERVTRMGGDDEQARAVGDETRRGLPAG